MLVAAPSASKGAAAQQSVTSSQHPKDRLCSPNRSCSPASVTFLQPLRFGICSADSPDRSVLKLSVRETVVGVHVEGLKVQKPRDMPQSNIRELVGVFEVQALES